MDAMQLPTDQELQEFAADWLKENFFVCRTWTGGYNDDHVLQGSPA